MKRWKIQQFYCTFSPILNISKGIISCQVCKCSFSKDSFIIKSRAALEKKKPHFIYVLLSVLYTSFISAAPFPPQHHICTSRAVGFICPWRWAEKFTLMAPDWNPLPAKLPEVPAKRTSKTKAKSASLTGKLNQVDEDGEWGESIPESKTFLNNLNSNNLFFFCNGIKGQTNLEVPIFSKQ